ncbi:SIMPL domain-containing protein [Thiomicrorhabdus aquaedulcis]|uniref:SIMPL domain-containing protein n=1 Tax=Thiomicrorhabdus aquaedulcis TaxID=2211106 RepID=UPI000FD86AF1|nr:SIMPL domain-containing protein [Thiomicrorhabdus aquaedulcis]
MTHTVLLHRFSTRFLPNVLFNLWPLRARLGLAGLFIIATLLHTPMAQANEPLGHKVDFTVTHSESVDNDRLSVQFHRVAQGDSAQAVADSINPAMQRALHILKSYPDITAQTSNYSIHPAYAKNNLISHWNGQQTLTIELDNQPGLVKVLSELQPHVTYQSMQFTVSKARTESLLEQFTTQAISRFKQQAELIRQSFGAQSLRILHSQINTLNDGLMPQPRFARAEMSLASAAQPALESGKSTLGVQVSGTILLLD